jgi:hypothetical protein
MKFRAEQYCVRYLYGALGNLLADRETLLGRPHGRFEIEAATNRFDPRFLAVWRTSLDGGRPVLNNPIVWFH